VFDDDVDGWEEGGSNGSVSSWLKTWRKSLYRLILLQ
jgi:hypothetical protein